MTTEIDDNVERKSRQRKGVFGDINQVWWLTSIYTHRTVYVSRINAQWLQWRHLYGLAPFGRRRAPVRCRLSHALDIYNFLAVKCLLEERRGETACVPFRSLRPSQQERTRRTVDGSVNRLLVRRGSLGELRGVAELCSVASQGSRRCGRLS